MQLAYYNSLESRDAADSLYIFLVATALKISLNTTVALKYLQVA